MAKAELESFDEDKLKCSNCKKYFDLEQTHYCCLIGVSRRQYRCKKCCLLDDVLIWLRTPVSTWKYK